MFALARRCALPLAAVLLLLGSAACGDARSTASRLGDTAVDSSDPRAHRLARLIRRADTFSTFTRALRQGALLQDLRRGGPYTVFAPTDRAFKRYMPGFDSLLAPAGSAATRRSPAPGAPDSLRRVLQFHLVRGRFAARNVKDSLRLGTVLMGTSLVLERESGDRARLRVRTGEEGVPPAPIRRTVEAQNGVLHVLGRPLRIPPPDTGATGALSNARSNAGAPTARN